MDTDTLAALARLIRLRRTAALGTLRKGAPLVSMVLYLPAADLSALFVHVSRLAWHTQDMLIDPRVSVSIAANDEGVANPQLLARVSLRGEAASLANDSAEYPVLKAAWLARYPDADVTFGLADFSFFRIAIRDARYVAGLGRIHNISSADLVDGSNLT